MLKAVSRMNHYRAVVLNPDRALKQELKNPQLVELEMKAANSVEQLSREVTKGKVDFVMLYERPERSGFELLHEIRKCKPDIPAILLVEPESIAWHEITNDQRTELVSSPAHAPELQHRIARLLGKAKRAPVPAGLSLTTTVQELRSLKSGKLDACLVADAFGLTLADVARSINKKLQAVHQTPDSNSLQKLLYPYERIASAVKYTMGSLQPALKIWLNAPNQTMPNNMPVDLIKNGHIEQLADLWDDTLLGHPD